MWWNDGDEAGDARCTALEGKVDVVVVNGGLGGGIDARGFCYRGEMGLRASFSFAKNRSFLHSRKIDIFPICAFRNVATLGLFLLFRYFNEEVLARMNSGEFEAVIHLRWMLSHRKSGIYITTTQAYKHFY